MFHRAKKLASKHRERIISLVLVPALFLGTLPHTACICADGHREEHCRAMACRLVTQRPAANAACGCRKDTIAKDARRSCCLAKRSLDQPVSGLVAATGSCCHPIVEAPAPAVVSGKADPAAKSILCAAIEPLVTLWSADDFRPARERSQHSTPPPLDATIVYLHLTI